MLRSELRPLHPGDELPGGLLVAHGEPVHDRDGFLAALDREPWSDWAGA